jgi:hypothetical protein
MICSCCGYFCLISQSVTFICVHATLLYLLRQNYTLDYVFEKTLPFCDCMYSGADKSLARPTPRYILFDGENISFDASLVIYLVYSINIPPIMIINRTYENQNLLSP